MQVFYLPTAQLGPMILPEEESKHCVRVLRMEAGTKFAITNGKGRIFEAVLRDPHPKRAVVELLADRPGYDHWPFRLEIGIAPTKNNDRLEWFLEKATEIGIDEVHLFTSFHSERRQVKIDRLEKVMVAALKQSVKSRLPQLNDIESFEKLVRLPFQGKKLIAWIDESVGVLLSKTVTKGDNCRILIGPEGDFSSKEVALAIQHGYVPVSLGTARLRTETAALVAIDTVQLMNQLDD